MKYYNYPNTTEVAEDIDTKNISNYASGGGAFIVNLANDDTYATDKTAKEIFDAACVGMVIFIMSIGADGISAMLVSSVFYAEGDGYYVQLSSIDGTFTLIADSDNATTWTLQGSNA